MAKVADLYADLRLDATNFSSGLKKATSSAKAAGDEMANAFGDRPQKEIEETDEEMERLTWNTRGSWKDIGKVVTGILISQGFYRLLAVIKDITGALATFSANCETAAVSFGLLLGSTDKANQFVAALEQFAAKTPFQVDQAKSLAKELLAMGFQAGQVIPVMRGLSDAASLSGGGDEVLSRMVMSIGQIKTTGYATGRELRELALAGLPVYKILQEQLHLTAKDMENIGKLRIPADTAIKAILVGIQERYKNAGQVLSKTLPGLWSTIKDDMLLMGKAMFSGGYDQIKSFISGVAEKLNRLEDTLSKGGIGGLFEAMFPPRLQSIIKSLIMGFQSLGKALGQLFIALKPITSAMFEFIVTFGSIAIPAISACIRVIATLATWIQKTCPWILKLIGYIAGLAICYSIAKGVVALATAIKTLGIVTAVTSAVSKAGGIIPAIIGVFAAHPIIAGIVAIVGAISAIILTSDRARQAVEGLIKRLGQLMGFDTSKMFTPTKTSDAAQKAIQDYIKGVGDLTDGITDTDDAIDNTGTAADKAKKKVDKYVESFDEVFQVPDKLDESGSDLGKVANALKNIDIPDLGNTNPNDTDPSNADGKVPWVPGIPWFKKWWDGVKDWFKSLQWADLPALPIPGFEAWWEAMRAWWKLVQGWFKGLRWPVLPPITLPTLDFPALPDILPQLQQWGQDVIGGVETVLNEGRSICVDFGKWAEGWATGTEDVIDGVLTALGETVPSVCAEVATAAESIGQSVDVYLQDELSGLLSFMSGVEIGVDTWVANTSLAVDTWCTNTAIAFDTWCTDEGTAIATWCTEAATDIGTWSLNAAVSIGTWATNTEIAIGNWAVNAGTSISTWCNTAAANIGTWASTTTTNVGIWATNTAKAIGTWVTNTADNIYKWGANVGINVTNVLVSTAKSFGSWVGNTSGAVAKWVTGTSKGIAIWASNAGSNVVAFANSAASAIASFASGSWSNIKSWISGTASGIYTWCGNVLNNIVSWAKSAWQTIKNLAASIGQSLGLSFQTANESFHKTTSSMGSWVNHNKNWLGPVLLGGAIVAGVGAAILTGGLSAPLLLAGLETGGIVNKEQYVKVGEHNHREAVVPLENSTYMQPFADAVANGIVTKLGTTKTTDNDTRPILYVGTLIADKRSLTELERKLKVVRLEETTRRG